MRSSIGAALCLCLGGGALACTPDDIEPTYARPDAAYTTERGLYTVEVGAAAGGRWPRVTGPSALKIRLEAHPDPAQSDLGTGVAVLPPFILAAGPARLEEVDASRTARAEASPAAPDGAEWTVALEFSAPGVWSLPLRIRDAGDRVDALELVFRIEPGGA